MNKNILDQLARTRLLSPVVSEAILNGNPPALEEVVMSLLIGTMDAEAMTRCDQESTWTEKRTARQGLIIAFLLALLCPSAPA
jgi:hypothetical protein